MKKTLEGIRVLDLTTFMSGPFAGTVLGDLGADNEEVLGQYRGLSPDDVARMKKEGSL
jgi:crotonobetainyl-CoA:carnitine CoA-transferase CaiB-like acyl-CoA transferase